MDANQLFHKSLLLLDRDRIEHGEMALRDAILHAKLARDGHTLGRALCCLGDLLCQLERWNDARRVLNEFNEERFPDDDVLDFERTRVAELIRDLPDNA